MNIAEIRQKYPQYDDLSDYQLAQGLHSKYYSDVPFRDFGKAIGLSGFEDISADPTEGMSYGGRVAAGAGKGLTDLGRGVKQLVGQADQAELQDVEKRDAALMDQPGAGVGSFLGKVAAPVVAAMTLPGAATYGGAAAIGGALGLAEPVATGDVLTGKAINAGIGAVGGVVGQKVGNVIAKKVTDKVASKAAAKVANATKDKTTQAGQDLGLTVPPTHANPTIKNRVLEGVAGKISTAQRVAEKNQSALDKIAKRAIGIPDDAPLSVEAVEAVRTAAGKAYDKVSKVPGSFAADQQYATALGDIAKQHGKLSQEFPELVPKDVGDFIASMDRPSFSYEGAVEGVKKMRELSRSLYKAADDPAKLAMAKAYRGVADALEKSMERNLAKSGLGDMVRELRQARQLIAKTYSVQNAMNEGTGHVIGRKLAAQLGRSPLTGELKTAAKFSAAYPRATQEITSSMPMISPLDVYASSGAAVASQNPLPLLLPLARVGARESMLTQVGQRMLTRPNYATNPLTQLVGKSASRVGSAAAVAPLIYRQQ